LPTPTSTASGHGPSLQGLVINIEPLHGFPPGIGGGHFLCLV